MACYLVGNANKAMLILVAVAVFSATELVKRAEKVTNYAAPASSSSSSSSMFMTTVKTTQKTMTTTGRNGDDGVDTRTKQNTTSTTTAVSAASDPFRNPRPWPPQQQQQEFDDDRQLEQQLQELGQHKVVLTSEGQVDWSKYDHLYFYHPRKAGGTSLVKWLDRLSKKHNVSFTKDEGFSFDPYQLGFNNFKQYDNGACLLLLLCD